MNKQLQYKNTGKQNKCHKGKRISEVRSLSSSFSLNSLNSQELPIAPEYIFQFMIPTSQILDVFEEISEALNFEMVERQLCYATAIKKQRKKSILDLLNCLNWWESSAKITAIKINIIKSEKTNKKLCCVRGLAGDISETKQFIEKFKKILKSMDIQASTCAQSPFSEQENQFREQSYNPFHLQACSDFMLHRLLSSSQTQESSINEGIKKMVADYYSSFQNTKESASLLPAPMKKAITVSIDSYEGVKRLLDKKSTNQDALMAFMQISVEKYIFNKLQFLLKQIYQEKTQAQNQIFLEKRQKIIESLTIEQIFQEVQLRKQLRIAEKSNQKSEFLSAREKIEFVQIACKELQKIQFVSNPREKVKHCQIMYASLKTYFYEKTNKKYELCSMEDIIPLFIVVILFSNMGNVRAELSMMVDFLNEHPEDYDGEKRSIINLSESYNYIVRDWRV